MTTRLFGMAVALGVTNGPCFVYFEAGSARAEACLYACMHVCMYVCMNECTDHPISSFGRETAPAQQHACTSCCPNITNRKCRDRPGGQQVMDMRWLSWHGEIFQSEHSV